MYYQRTTFNLFYANFQQAYNAIAVSRQMKLMVLNSSNSSRQQQQQQQSSEAATAATTTTTTSTGSEIGKQGAAAVASSAKAEVPAEVRRRFEFVLVQLPIITLISFCTPFTTMIKISFLCR